MRAIFVSYRRDDAEGEAGRLFDDLVEQFGEDSVFMDVAAIEVGRDFRKAIDESVSTCGVLLAVIGKQWIDAKNEAGQRRLDDPVDFVRLETASALKRDIPVVPVLVHGAKMPRSDQLPDDLKELAYRNGVEVTHARWNSDMQLLFKALRPFVGESKGAPASPAPTSLRLAAEIKPPVPVETKVPVFTAESSPTPKKKPMGIILAVVAAVLAVGAFVVYMMSGSKQVTVPDLSGITLSDATAKLQALDLAVGQKIGKEDPTKAPNIVLGQSPPPNVRVKTGSTIDLTYSQPPTMVDVPSLVGKSLDAAQQVLEDLHLPAGKISFEQKPNVAENIVLDQFPKPGKRVEGTAEISLVVSEAPVTQGQRSSPMVAVPNLVGQSLAQARARLQTSGLAVGSATPQPKPDATSGTVISQSPSAGQQVNRSTQVNLWVAQAPQVPPSSVANVVPKGGTVYFADGGEPVGTIWKLQGGTVSAVYRRPSNRIYSVAISRNGIIYFCNANENKVYQLQEEHERVVYTHNTYVRRLAFDHNGDLYFSEATGGVGDGKIYRHKGSAAVPVFSVRLSTVDGYWAGDFAFDSQGALWLSSGNRRPANLYKVTNGEPSRVFTSSDSIAGIAFAADGSLIYTDSGHSIYRLTLPALSSELLYRSPTSTSLSGVAPVQRQ